MHVRKETARDEERQEEACEVRRGRIYECGFLCLCVKERGRERERQRERDRQRERERERGA